jgi:hypothetical protein
MSFFKKLFSLDEPPNAKNSSKTDKKTGANIRKDLNPEHQQIVKLYTQKNPTPFTSKEIVESIAEELGKKPGGVRSILSKAGVYIKQEKLTYKNNKELCLEKANEGEFFYIYYRELNDELKNDKEIACLAIASDPYSFKDLPNELKYDKELLMNIMESLADNNREAAGYILDCDLIDHYENDKEVLLKVWNNLDPKTRTVSDISNVGKPNGNVVTRDKQFMLEAVQENLLNFLYVAPNLMDDAELLDIVKADNYSDYAERVHPVLLEERYPEDDEDDEDEVIEIP